MKFLLTLLLLSGAMTASCQEWQSARLAGVTVRHAGLQQHELDSLRRLLGGVVNDLAGQPGLDLCDGPVLTVHPDLDSYLGSTGAAWFQLAMADRAACRVDVQRLPILEDHGGVEATLRHEMFHLAQPAGMSRWRAEGEAQRFAGERPSAPVLPGVTPGVLDRLLFRPPSQTVQLRAMATALAWVLQGR